MSKKAPVKVPMCNEPVVPYRSVDWPAFAENLGSALAAMTEDQYLILSKKESNQYIQYYAQGAWGMRIETISNYYRDEEELLSVADMGRLVAVLPRADVAAWLRRLADEVEANDEQQVMQ
jgi:hypothetical protein